MVKRNLANIAIYMYNNIDKIANNPKMIIIDVLFTCFVAWLLLR